MAVSAIIGAVSAAGVALGVAAPIFAGGLFGLGVVATQFLVTTAMGAALNALAPKPNLSGLSNSRGYSLQGESGAALDHQIIYGRARVGGVRIYDASSGTDNAFLHRIIAFAGHEVESFDEIYLNDEIVTLDGSGNVTSPSRYNGLVTIQKRFGTTTQTAFTGIPGGWGTNHRLLGIAYLYVRFEFNADAFPNGVPAVSATIKGKKVFDPRTSTTAWSDNPALCLRDYITSAYGLNQNSSRVDDALCSFAANVCDEMVDGEKRYTCNGSFTTGFTPNQVISDLITSMGGLFWYSQGKWRMKAAKYLTPTVTLDEGDLRSGINLSTRHSRRSNFNTVKGTFRGPETDWQTTDYPSVSDPSFVADDNGIVNTLDFPLPFTVTSKTAQRLANIALRRNREQLTFSASFGLKAFQVQVGDFVYVNNARFGWTNKVFEVTTWTFGLTDGLDLQVQMTLREISPAVFSEEPASAFESNNTTLPSPFTGLEITGLTASAGGNLSGDGTFIPSTILQWNPAASSFVRNYEVEWKPVSDSVYSSTTTVETSIELSPIIDGISYDYRVRAITQTNNGGPRAAITFTSGGDVTPPGLPTSISAVPGYQTITVVFSPPTDADFSRVEVFESSTNLFTDAVSIGFTSGSRFVRSGLPNNATRWYWLRSIDFSGNESAFTSPVSTTTAVIEETDLAQSLIDTINAAGVAVVNSLPAEGDFNGQIVFLLTDNTLYRWDEANEVWSTELFTDIKDNSVTTAKLVASAVTANEIAAGAVTTDKLVSNELSAMFATIGVFSSAATGERVVIEDDRISVFDSSNNLRVRMGRLT